MAKATAFPILAFIAVILVCSSVFVESANPSPFIVAHKRVSRRKLNPSLERISVSVDIYNSGSEPAYDVTLTDDNWAGEVFDSIIGNTSKSWERLDAGSLVSHSFELESKTKTVYYGAPAVITFRVPTKTKLQEAYSTPILPLNILSDPTTENKLELAKGILMKYGSHASVLLLVGVFAHIIANPSKSSGNKKKH